MKKTIMQKTAIVLALSALSLTAMAESPWTLEEGQYSISLSRVNENFTAKWLGTVKSAIPEINQQTTWLSGSYGIADNLQVSIITGRTSSDFDGSSYEYSGRADSSIGMKYRAFDQYQGCPLTLSIYVGATIAGTYERSAGGRPHSPGDKADSVELIIPLARSFGRYVLLSEIGYRARTDDVPNEILFNLGGGVSIGPVYLQGLYRIEDSIGGLNIAQAPFTPDRFHETEEDRTLFDFSISYSFLQNWTAYLGIGNVLTGKNTGDSDIVYFGISYTR